MREFAVGCLLAFSACSQGSKIVPVGFEARRCNFISDCGGRFSLRGHITLVIPAQYDTLLTWIDRSDAGGTPKYRFTNSKGCLIQESGFFKREDGYCKDSIDRMTIETGQSFDLGLDTLNLERISRSEREYYQTRHQRNPVWKAPAWRSRSREKINGRTFVIKEFYGSSEFVEEPYKQLVAVTEFRQGPSLWYARFRFECKQKDCRNFAKNAYTVLNSVRIDTVASK